MDCVPGVNGTDGVPGVNGTDGVSGVNGTDCVPGLKGNNWPKCSTFFPPSPPSTPVGCMLCFPHPST